MNDVPDSTTAQADVAPRDESAESGAAPPVEDGELQRLQRERDDYYDRLLRSTAEFDNYRKRIDRERREQADRAAAGLIEELLPIVDDFERALKVETAGDATVYREGLTIIHRQLMDLLARRGVTAIDTEGTDFDPHVHQAVVYDPAPGHRDGEVIEELRRGYMLGDRLLRPAMVKVAKA
jgi:molecular chaperone GrpE